MLKLFSVVVGISSTLLSARAGAIYPAISPCVGHGRYSAPSDLLQAREYTIVPFNPKAGDIFHAGFSGTITEQIDGGVIAIDVKIGGIIPIYQNVSLALVNDIRRQLPLKPGHFELEETIKLPDFLFGKVEGTVRIYSNNEKQITCVKIHIDLGS